MTSSIPAHPKILHLGKTRDLFKGTIICEEKVDGSSFAFGRAADDGRLVFRSKGRELFPESVDKLFGNTVAAVQAREAVIMDTMEPGAFLYGEALHAPRHNTLTYERAPKGHLVLFGGTVSNGDWMSREQLELFADAFDFEITPILARWVDVTDADIEGLVKQAREMAAGPSILGGKREGIVLKNYGQQIHYNGVLSPIFCKVVTDDFKEKHNDNWKPGKDHLQDLLDGYRSEARWHKAVQHLREQGVLTETVKDIGPLVRRVQDDVVAEEMQELGMKLAQHFIAEVKRISTRGLPEFYKGMLMDEIRDEPSGPDQYPSNVHDALVSA